MSPPPTMSEPLPEMNAPALLVRFCVNSSSPPSSLIWPAFVLPDAGERERLPGLPRSSPAAALVNVPPIWPSPVTRPWLVMPSVTLTVMSSLTSSVLPKRPPEPMVTA